MAQSYSVLEGSYPTLSGSNVSKDPSVAGFHGTEHFLSVWSLIHWELECHETKSVMTARYHPHFESGHPKERGSKKQMKT